MVLRERESGVRVCVCVISKALGMSRVGSGKGVCFEVKDWLRGCDGLCVCARVCVCAHVQRVKEVGVGVRNLFTMT